MAPVVGSTTGAVKYSCDCEVVQHSHGRVCRTVVNAASHVDDVGRDVCAMHPAIDEGQQRAFVLVADSVCDNSRAAAGHRVA